MPIRVGLNADGDRRYHWLLMLVWLEQDANLRRTYGRCLAPIDAAGHIATSSHGRMHRIANTMRLSALDSESFRRTHFALSLQEWHAPHSSTASNRCTCTAEWECECTAVARAGQEEHARDVVGGTTAYRLGAVPALLAAAGIGEGDI